MGSSFDRVLGRGIVRVDDLDTPALPRVVIFEVDLPAASCQAA